MKISLGRFIGKDTIKRSQIWRVSGFVSIMLMNEVLRGVSEKYVDTKETL